MFGQSRYSVNERDEPAQAVLVLSNPSSTDFAVQITTTDDSATGMYVCMHCISFSQPTSRSRS